MGLPPTLSEKKSLIISNLRRERGVVVALSGGVDSAVLLALALEALGTDRVLAVTGRSPSLAARDEGDARRVARTLGARHRVVDTAEIEREGYRANAGDRCYHCRTELFEVLRGVADERGFPALAYGAIREDGTDYRPGMRAAAERGILAPLLEAGLGKEEVRELARDYGLEVGDKPAGACLASRIPVGTEVSAGRLGQVERAESALAGLGFRQFRVRHHGEVARVELDAEGMARIADPAVRAEVVRAVRAAGFRFATLDLEGYRTGSLNP